MAKITIYYEEAQRLFVQEGLSIDEILGMLDNKVSRKTLYNWKKEGDWDKERNEYLRQKKELHEEIKDIARLTIKRAKADPTPANLLSMFRAISVLRNFEGLKLLEDETNPKERKKLTEEAIKEIEKKMGLV